MEYEFADCCTLKGDPNVLVERIQKISAKVGRIDPEAIIRDAKSPNSPLHACYEWDDRVAAHLYRLEQTRYIIRSLVHKLDDNGNAMPKTRVFISLENEESRFKPGDYVHTLTAMSDAEQRARILNQAVREIEEHKNKYDNLKEMASYFSAVKRVMPSVRRAVATAISRSKRKAKHSFKRPGKRKEKHGYPFVRR